MPVASIDGRQLNTNGGTMNSLTLLYSFFALTGTPSAPAQTAMRASGDSVLTAQAITKMIDFWRFTTQEPDSLVFGDRSELTVKVGTFGQQGYKKRMDLISVTKAAARHSSVAADLQKAGLTAEQFDLYWEMIKKAYLVIGKDWSMNPQLDDVHYPDSLWLKLTPTAVEAQNIDFINANGGVRVEKGIMAKYYCFENIRSFGNKVQQAKECDKNNP